MLLKKGFLDSPPGLVIAAEVGAGARVGAGGAGATGGDGAAGEAAARGNSWLAAGVLSWGVNFSGPSSSEESSPMFSN